MVDLYCPNKHTNDMNTPF